MKKTLLLSVVASTMIMAGGDIAPVEPVVEAPVEVSAWNFSGDAVAYMQTIDAQGEGDLFGGDTTSGGLGLSLRAMNDDVFGGIGFGAEVSSIAAGHNNGFSNSNFGLQDGDALTQAYLTYGMDSISTSLKVGRQHLPKSLSPFAFTEGWQMIKNSFDAALLVNSSLPDTTFVYAYVTKANNSVGDISNFNNFHNEDGTHMITLSNKSISNLTLTGSYYMLPDATDGLGLVGGGDADAWWLDGTYKSDAFTVALQGGEISPDGLDSVNAFGAKIAGNAGMFGLALAYSSVSDGGTVGGAAAVGISNLAGTGVKTPLYTQSILNQDAIKNDADAWKASATMKALGGGFGLHYIYADLGTDARGSTFNNSNVPVGGSASGEGEYTEIDLTYKTKMGENTTLFAGYVYQDDDRLIDSQNFLRFWARYNF